jgi:hypothetical protein
VHFHVPIHSKAIGPLGTTQHDLLQSLEEIPTNNDTLWEVETYTWDVMPTCFQENELINSITSEIRWANKQIQSVVCDE